MSLYLDCNVVVALLTPDALSDRAVRIRRPDDDFIFVSDFAAAEFAAVISRRVRTRTCTRDEGRTALDKFDAWVAATARGVELSPADIVTAGSYLRRLDLTLSAPDAIHIATAQRLGASLLTFDRAMAAAARVLGVTLVEV